MRSLIGLVLASGCSEAPLELTNCQVDFSPDVHTVLEARWTSSAPGPSHVEYDLDGAAQRTPIIDDGSSEHSAVLLGLRPLADVAWTLVTENGDQRAECSGTTGTENVIPQTAGLRITEYDPELSGPEKYVFGSTYFGQNPSSTVFLVSKEDGELRWYAQGDDEQAVVQASFARGVDGSSVLANGVRYNAFDKDFSEDTGVIVTRSPDGATTATLRTVLGHHGFTELPDGTTAYLAIDPIEWTSPEGETLDVAGDSLFEVGPDGVPREIFSIRDHEEIAPNPWWTESLYPGLLDWSHGDSLRWNEALQAYVVSFAHLEQVWLIGRDGVPIQRMGRNTSVPPAEGVDWQLPHDAQILDDGSLLVFLVDSGLSGSGCRQFTVGPDELTPVWSYDAPLVARFLGRCSRLPGGNTLVGFGNGGAVREVTPDGRVAWSAQATDASGIGSVALVSDLYPPASPR